METNTLLLILWEICGVTWSIGNPHQWHTFTNNQFYGNYMVVHTSLSHIGPTFHIYGNYMVVQTWLSHILSISLGIIW